MKNLKKYFYVFFFVLCSFPVYAIGVEDASQFPQIILDFLQNDFAQGLSENHKEQQKGIQKAIGVQNSISKMTQENSLKRTLLGKSNVLKRGFDSLGINYTDPTKAMSNETLKAIRSELIMPSSPEKRAEMRQEKLDQIMAQQVKNFQTAAVQSTAEAWVAQTEAAARAKVLDSIGKDINSGRTHTDVLVSLIRISAETAAELNARVAVQAGELKGKSGSILLHME